MIVSLLPVSHRQEAELLDTGQLPNPFSFGVGSRFLELGQPKDKFCSVVVKKKGLTSGQSLIQAHIFFLGGEGEHKIWEVLVEYQVIQWCISVLICTNLDDTPPFLFCSSIQAVWICLSVSLSLSLCISVSLGCMCLCYSAPSNPPFCIVPSLLVLFSLQMFLVDYIFKGCGALSSVLKCASLEGESRIINSERCQIQTITEANIAFKAGSECQGYQFNELSLIVGWDFG